jgi:hypothetical protein
MDTPELKLVVSIVPTLRIGRLVPGRAGALVMAGDYGFW